MIPQTLKRILVLCLALCTAVAHAHPGHGPGDVPPAHWLTSPDHAGLMLAAAVVLFCSVRALNWRKSVKGER